MKTEEKYGRELSYSVNEEAAVGRSWAELGSQDFLWLDQLLSLPSLQLQGSYGERWLSWEIGTAWKEKKRNPRQVSQRVQTSEGGQSAVDAGGGAGLTGGWDLWPWCISWGSVSLALQTGVTSFTCDLLESCPSSSTGRLLNPAAGPSPDEPVAGEWRMEVEEARA